MNKSKINDPFEKARLENGFGEMNDQDDPVVMVLGHKDVRRCAHNWKTFQSAAKPGRIVIPSEVNLSLIHISEPTRLLVQSRIPGCG